MDAKQAQQMTIDGSVAAQRIKKCVEWIEKRILKAIQKGKWEVVICTQPDTPFFSPCYYLDDEERSLIKEYLTKELGFNCDSPNPISTTAYKIDWRPSNFKQVFMPRTEDSKLKHVVLTGQAPIVFMGEEDDNS